MELKYPHDLHTSQNVEELINKLKEKNIDILSIVKSTIKDKETPFGIIFTGSIIEKNGNNLSDLDVQVLYDTLETEYLDSEFEGKNKVLEKDNWKEIVEYVSGVEINIGFHSIQELQKLRDSMTSLAPALINPKELKKMAMIGEENLQFMHELKSGWVYHGEEIISKWRDLLMVDALGIYLSIHHFIKSKAYIQDAFSNFRLFKRTPAFMGTYCVKFCILSLLANAGYTSQRQKWFFNFCDRIEDEKYKSLVDYGLTLLHPNMEQVCSDLDSEKEFIEKVYDFHLTVKNTLTENEVVKNAISHITNEFKYVINNDQLT